MPLPLDYHFPEMRGRMPTISFWVVYLGTAFISLSLLDEEITKRVLWPKGLNAPHANTTLESCIIVTVIMVVAYIFRFRRIGFVWGLLTAATCGLGSTFPPIVWWYMIPRLRDMWS